MSYRSVLNVSNGRPSNPKLTLKINSLRIKREAQNFASWMLNEYALKIRRKKGMIFLSLYHFKQVQEKQTWERFSGGSEYPWNLRGKMTYFFGLKNFQVLWETPKSRFGSFAGRFAGRFPGPRSFLVFWETHAWSVLARTQFFGHFQPGYEAFKPAPIYSKRHLQ